MKRISNAVIVLLCICIAPISFADDSDATNASSVELWVCNYQEGKSIDDLRDWYRDFNRLSDQMDNGNFRSWLWSPFFVSDLTRADVVVATAFPNLESMGQSMMSFGMLRQGPCSRDRTIVDCHGREL